MCARVSIKGETTYHTDVNLNRSRYPERIRVPGQIVLENKRLVDVPRPHAAYDGDEEAEAEEEHDGCALPPGHGELVMFSIHGPPLKIAKPRTCATKGIGVIVHKKSAVTLIIPAAIVAAPSSRHFPSAPIVQ